VATNSSCNALGIDAQEHHAAVAADKAKIQAKMRELTVAGETS
jgi:hypothetical protein